MSSSKLTTKFQATIPKDVRNALELKAGDLVVFETLENGTVVIRKQRSFDREYHKALEKTLSEWESGDDERAFKHLQDI